MTYRDEGSRRPNNKIAIYYFLLTGRDGRGIFRATFDRGPRTYIFSYTPFLFRRTFRCIHAIFFTKLVVVHGNEVFRPIIALNSFGQHTRFACTSVDTLLRVRNNTDGQRVIPIDITVRPRPVRDSHKST